MRIALVLGAGGARGYAHLGALEVLRERGHEIVAISGTSMGALVGGLAAAGKDQEFADWVRTLTQRGVLRLMDPAIKGPGAVYGNRVVERISGILGDVDIEDLPVPFTAVATDLTNQREVWFQRGPLLAAIRASIAIPGALTPVEMGGRLLVDGGILNPLPVGPVLAVDADVTMAVDLSGSGRPRLGAAPLTEEAEVPGDTRSWLGRIGFAADREKPKRDGLRTLDVMLAAFETMQGRISRLQLAANPPDVVVSVPLASARTLEFHRATELIDLGRRLTEEALDDRPG